MSRPRPGSGYCFFAGLPELVSDPEEPLIPFEPLVELPPIELLPEVPVEPLAPALPPEAPEPLPDGVLSSVLDEPLVALPGVPLPKSTFEPLELLPDAPGLPLPSLEPEPVALPPELAPEPAVEPALGVDVPVVLEPMPGEPLEPPIAEPPVPDGLCDGAMAVPPLVALSWVAVLPAGSAA